jgi:hypothetical protein
MPRRRDPDDDGPPPGSLERHMKWLYPDPAKPCICKSAWVNGGRLHGINMGKQWARTSTEPGCYHHGTEAQKFYDDNLRRFRKTGDWAEFHVDRDEWERAHKVQQFDGSAALSEDGA